jgi:curved DNA-binding protein CbpA
MTQDYYTTLSVDPKATQQQIRDAYKKAALKHHPDRVPANSPERSARTKRFQAVNDAYYTLSDPARRREYDAARAYNSWTGSTATPDAEWEDEVPAPDAGAGAGAGAGGFNFGSFPWSAFGFGSSGASKPAGNTEESHNRFSEEQFGGIFEEMLKEEGMADQDAGPTGKFWSMVGGLSGGAMGFIVANFPGMVAGAVAGNRLGSVRDAKGKSVYSVFQEMPQADKARLLSSLAAKVLSSAVSG